MEKAYITTKELMDTSGLNQRKADRIIRTINRQIRESGGRPIRGMAPRDKVKEMLQIQL